MNLLRFAGALAVAMIVPAQAQMTEVVLHSFEPQLRGGYPNALLRDSAGNLYGTAAMGGSANHGLVFKLDTSGHQTVLYSFHGADGADPLSGVIADSSGNLYGTTNSGGAFGAGVVYKLSPNGTETVLYSFTGGGDGGYPAAGVIRDSSGNLYGTTAGGGVAGVVYEISAAGKETVLFEFTGGLDGFEPAGGVIRDSSGNLYGVTRNGGTSNLGVVYELSPSGQETVLHNFTGGSDGSIPQAGVIRDSAGNLYGTASSGGKYGWGVVYKINSSVLTVLYAFMNSGDGALPYSGVTHDSSGNLYGTTFYGAFGEPGGVYKLDTAGTETVLHNFSGGQDGSVLYNGVILDPSGNIYGTTTEGGIGNSGIVYELNPAGAETILYGFPAPTDGYQPYGGLVRAPSGTFYGTTCCGGLGGEGAVFTLNSAGHETLLSNLGGVFGNGPMAGVALDSAGNVYGTAVYGGLHEQGAVYKVDPAGNTTMLYSFLGGNDGANPSAGVILDSAGSLYGTTKFGGASNSGVIYKVTASGAETLLHTFAYADGGYPTAGLIRDSAGNLYGTTTAGGSAGFGVVFKLSTSGQLSVLHNFSGTDGESPYAAVVSDAAGNLYGTTYAGGTAGAGVIYKVAPNGFTVLYNFTGAADGGNPYAGLVRDSSGNLYGTTYMGGAANAGVVFELDTSGNETVLYSFTGGEDGGNPYAGLIRESSGALFGTTYAGGKYSVGVVFELQN